MTEDYKEFLDKTFFQVVLKHLSYDSSFQPDTIRLIRTVNGPIIRLEAKGYMVQDQPSYITLSSFKSVYNMEFNLYVESILNLMISKLKAELEK